MLHQVLGLALLSGLIYGQEWQLVWEDNFDFLDPTKWEFESTAWGGGNSEFQVYTPAPENTEVRNGLLYIKPTLLIDNINPLTGEPFGEDFLANGVLDLYAMYGSCTDSDPNQCVKTGGDIPPIASARLRSAGRFAFRYGRAEMRAKMPVGDWMWPAMWMLPEHWVYGDWPRSGEIDIIEMIGNRDLKMDNEDIGIQYMGSTLHWGLDWQQNRWYLTYDHMHDHAQNFGDYFHDYVFEWDENSMRWYIDGRLLLTIPDPPANEQPGWNFYDFGAPWDGPNVWENGTPLAPFDEEFHFILNVAVGGTNGYIPDGAVNRGDNNAYGKPWHNSQHKQDAMWDFWNARQRWDWNWEQEGDNAALQVDYIRVYQRA